MRESHLDVAEVRGKEHGRRICRRLQCSTRLAEHSDWPGLRQVCRLTRTTHRHGEEVVEIAYAVSSVPRSSTLSEVIVRFTSKAKHPLVYSSTIDSHLIGRGLLGL